MRFHLESNTSAYFYLKFTSHKTVRFTGGHWELPSCSQWLWKLGSAQSLFRQPWAQVCPQSVLGPSVQYVTQMWPPPGYSQPHHRCSRRHPLPSVHSPVGTAGDPRPACSSRW